VVPETSNIEEAASFRDRFLSHSSHQTMIVFSARRQKEGGRRQKVERLIRLTFGSVVN
jgi:hypothetical protein